MGLNQQWPPLKAIAVPGGFGYSKKFKPLFVCVSVQKGLLTFPVQVFSDQRSHVDVTHGSLQREDDTSED